MPRPSKWRHSPTVAIRIPECFVQNVEGLLEHLDALPPGEGYQPSLKADLIKLLRRHEHKLQGMDEWIHTITSPRYMKRTLQENVLNQKYRDVAFALAGHHTNDGCRGIFANANEHEIEPLLLLLLMELASSVDRPTGGTVHQMGRGEDAA